MRRVGIAAALVCAASGAHAAGKDCDHSRECLAGVMSAYLQALAKHDPAGLPTTRNVKYTENGVRLTLGDGLWQTASAPPTYRLDVVDEEAGSVGMIGRISENGNNNWYGVRLKVEPDGKVSQIETLVSRSASGPAGGPPGRRQAEHRAAPTDGAGHSGEQAAAPRGARTHRQLLFHGPRYRGKAARAFPSRRNVSGVRTARSRPIIRRLRKARWCGWTARRSSTPAFPRSLPTFASGASRWWTARRVSRSAGVTSTTTARWRSSRTRLITSRPTRPSFPAADHVLHRGSLQGRGRQHSADRGGADDGSVRDGVRLVSGRRFSETPT